MSDSYTSSDSPTMNVTPASQNGAATPTPEAPKPPASAEPAQTTDASQTAEALGQAETVNADAEVIDVEVLEQEQQNRSYEVHQEGALTYFQYFLEDENDAFSPGAYGAWRADNGGSPRSFVSAGAVGVGVLAATFGAGLLVAEATNRNAANQEANGNALERLNPDADANLDAGSAAAIAQGSPPESLTPDWSSSQKLLETQKSVVGPAAASGSLLAGGDTLGEAASRLAAAKSEVKSGFDSPATSPATAMMAPMAASPLISRPSWSTTTLSAAPALTLPRATLATLPTPVTAAPAPFPEPSSSVSTWTQTSSSPNSGPAQLPPPPLSPVASAPISLANGNGGDGSQAQAGGTAGVTSADEQALRDRLTALRDREATVGSTNYQRPVSRDDLATPGAPQTARPLAPAEGTSLNNVFVQPGELAAAPPLNRPVGIPATPGPAPMTSQVNNVAAPVAGLLPVAVQQGRPQVSPTSRQPTGPAVVAPRSGEAAPQARARQLTPLGAVNAPEYSPAIELSVIPAPASALSGPLIDSLEQLQQGAEAMSVTAPPVGLSRQAAATASQNPSQLGQFRLVSLSAEAYQQLWQRSLTGQALDRQGANAAGLDRSFNGNATAQGSGLAPVHGFVDYQNQVIAVSAAPTAPVAEANLSRSGRLPEPSPALASVPLR